MTIDTSTPACYNCAHYHHKVEKRGAVLKARQWCELTKRRVNPSMKGCFFHKYAPRYRLKGATNAPQQTRHP